MGKPETPKAAAGTAMPVRQARSKEGVAEAREAATMTSEEWKAIQKGMAAKWPKPTYMAESDKPTAGPYRDPTYEIVTRWHAGTRISYRPHAKAPGSKSHIRYETYAKAKTIGESLKKGSFPIDWCYDFEHGFIKVLGDIRDEPLDMSKVEDESTLTDVDTAIY
ncbi:unnamed protein product, partial [Polarella glacialis]